MTPIVKQVGANRIVRGVKIPNPWGVPTLPEDENMRITTRILTEALTLLQTDVSEPTIVSPRI